jgi:glycosyltransferase involved in cell wall biosynthesis
MPRVLVNLLQSTGTKGGIEVYARELYRALGALQSDFDFVGYGSTELVAADHSWFPGEMIASGISGENRFAWARGELFSVSRVASRLKVDLIHGPAMFGPLRSAVPTVITVHDLLYFSHPELMQTRLFVEPVKWMEKRAAAGASRLITISEYSAAAIRKYLHFPADRIDVIPLAARKHSAPSSPAVNRRHDLFLAMGQRSPYKNFETIVRGWSLIEPSERPRLIITGGGPSDPLRPLVDSLGLRDSVDLRDWVSTEELNQLTSTATALIDSTLATGFSLPAIEAMSVGLPVLLADTTVFREVGGDAADYFSAADPSALAKAVLQLAADRTRRRELGRLGRDRAALTSWQRVASLTLESFRLAIAGGRRR